MDNGALKLSDSTIKRMRSVGIDPEKMNEEELQAIESLEKPEKNHWLINLFTRIGILMEILALFSLLSAEWDAVLGYGIVGLILMYIGYRIQIRIVAHRLIQITIKRDAEEKIKAES